ncbi:anti-sigma factor [Cyanobium sp. T1G-Tous]|uniref:anti-sigma factor n=1 Tax=Cyanobium sp. T1G-Tous TaxID=2823722 RepID=UPI0020CD2B05|nr:anti-sigma factor [Cyanobium sp. T1G-Tous]MCP9802396.1 anti-sigma factor [Cyanobium sp. T1G-Tous]
MAALDPNRPDRHDSHPQLNELMAGYVLGDLDEGERQELRKTLASDPHLQSQLDELRLTLELLPMALPNDATPPARLRRRLLQSEQNRHQPRTEEQARRWPLRPAQLGMAAMACGLVALGTQVVQLREEMTNLRQATPATASRTLALRGTSGHAGISGKVVVSPGQDHNLLLVRGLPPAPPTHVYRLWANVNGRTKGCVRFVPNADGSVAMPIPTQPSSQAQALSITLEPLQPDGSTPDGPELLTSV